MNSACGLGASVHGYGQLDLNMPCSRYSFVPQCCSVHASFFFFWPLTERCVIIIVLRLKIWRGQLLFLVKKAGYLVHKL